MARTDNLKNYLTDVANAIREKTNTTDKIKASEFDDKIKGISGASEQWEWALDNVINFGSANPTFFRGNTYLKVLPNYFNEECVKITDWSNAFNGCSNLVDVDIDTSAGTNFTSTFRACTKLTNESITNLNFNKMTNGFAMFGYGTKITQLPNFNHEIITNMGEMFWASALSDLGETDLNFPKVTNADYIFGETQITKVPNLSFPEATTAKGLFQSCLKLNTISGLNISKITNISKMFQGCSNLESVPTLDLSSAQYISYLFQGCSKIKTVKLVNVPDRSFVGGAFYVFNNCTSLERIERTANPLCRGDCNNFASGCTSLVEFDQDTSKVTSFYQMFVGDTSLETIRTIDGTASQGFIDTFRNCSALKNIEIAPNTIKWNISFSSSPLLTDTTIQNIIDGLATVTSQQTLTLHADVKSKLTDEQKSAITSKNWLLA